jgi:DNA-binding MarR family transcriptional regulator
MELEPGMTGREVAAEAGPFGYALAQAVWAHREDLQRRMAALGLHLGQELLLVDLHQHPGTTQADLVRRIGMEQPTIANSVSRMERAGFIRRESDPKDRRITRLSLTPQGESAVEGVVTGWVEADRVATAGMRQSEIDELVRLLYRTRDNHA